MTDLHFSEIAETEPPQYFRPAMDWRWSRDTDGSINLLRPDGVVCGNWGFSF